MISRREEIIFNNLSKELVKKIKVGNTLNQEDQNLLDEAKNLVNQNPLGAPEWAKNLISIYQEQDLIKSSSASILLSQPFETRKGESDCPVSVSVFESEEIPDDNNHAPEQEYFSIDNDRNHVEDFTDIEHNYIADFSFFMNDEELDLLGGDVN